MTTEGKLRAPAAGAIALYARATHGFDGRVAHATAVLQSAALEHAGRIVQVTSLGVEGMVLTDLIVRNQLGIAVATIDTGRLHPQTSALVPEIEARYGIAVEVHRPQPQAVARFVAAHGEDAMRESLALRKSCCELRKIEPLSRLLAGRSAWVTGLRREQSHARAVVSFHERDDAGRVKFNPLADWSWADIWHYAAQHDVPYNPLHDEFMPSIGCAPCTRAITVGADFRSGRWWWESESAKECGLHVSVHSRAAKAAAPSQREGGGGFASAQADFGNAEVKGAQAPDRSQSESAKECGLHVRTRTGAAKAAAPEELEAPA